MARYGDNIRRIARTKEILDLIQSGELELLEKAPINGKRGIAYNTSNGTIITQTGAPGETNADKLGDSQSRYGDGEEAGGIDDTETDGDDLLTNTPAKGEDIGEIALEDCTTGQPIDVRFNTGGNEGEAIFKHPEGFGVDGTGPEYQQWTSGVYWETNVSGTVTRGTSAYDAAKSQLGALDSANPGNAPHAIVGLTANDSTPGVDDDPVTPNRYTVEYSRAVGSNFTGPVDANSCSGSGFEGNEDICASSDPEEYEWLDSVNSQLAYNAENGGFFSSSNDTNIPLKFKNTIADGKAGLSKLELCTDGGNEVVVQVLRTGEFVYFEDDGFGQPDTSTNPIRKFDSEGKYIGTISEDEYDAESFV